jgi:hypothetical protein
MAEVPIADVAPYAAADAEEAGEEAGEGVVVDAHRLDQALGPLAHHLLNRLNPLEHFGTGGMGERAGDDPDLS